MARSTTTHVLAKVVRFALAAIASAAFACVSFFTLLALWGIAFAPFVRLESASFVVACALAGSVVSTIVAWRVVHRRYRNFFSS